MHKDDSPPPDSESVSNPALYSRALLESLANGALPLRLAALEAQGDYEAVEGLIRDALEAGGWPDAVQSRNRSLGREMRGMLEQELVRLDRLRKEYSLGHADLLAKMQKQMRGVKAADLERWRRRGMLQSLVLDGKVRYFRREPANLLKLSAAARRRLLKPTSPPPPATSSQTRRTKAAPAAAAGGGGLIGASPATALPTGRRYPLLGHIRQALNAAHEAGLRAGQDGVLPVRHEFDFRVRVKPGAVAEGELIRCWIPFPQEYGPQRRVELLEAGPGKTRTAPAGTAHRTVYLEQASRGSKAATEFHVRFAYETVARVTFVETGKVRPLSAAERRGLAAFVEERPPHIEFTAELKKLCARILGKETNPYLQARRIFEWMHKNIRYAFEMEYAAMPSVQSKILATRRGDCGVQAILFIALCRAAGIPARWQSGWATIPGRPGMHDWAEFYIAPYGWLPADPSYSLKPSRSTEVRWFYFGNLDSFRLVANLDFGREFSPRKTFERSDPIDLQRGEVEGAGGNLFFDQWEYEVHVTQEPLGDRKAL